MFLSEQFFSSILQALSCWQHSGNVQLLLLTMRADGRDDTPLVLAKVCEADMEVMRARRG